MNTVTTKIAITFPNRLVARLRDKAEFEFGFDIPEIVRKLVADYIASPLHDTSYLTPEQEAKYSADIQETKKLLKLGKISAANSLQEFKKQIENDTL